MRKISHKSMQAGFTLIELMIAVSIVSSLASIAIPTYETYVIRAQVAEGFTLAEGAKAAEVEYYAVNGHFEYLENLVGGQPSGRYVSMVYTSGYPTYGDYGPPTFGGFGVRVSYNQPTTNSKIRAGGYITFTPKDDDSGNIHWACTGDGIYITQRYLPSSCTNS